MLSVENPPRDPPCRCEISQLESGSDERASAKLEAETADLLNSAAGLVDDNIYQLPKFSIRDYVFSTRSKDITNNWPFSQEKLQVCLKHGMTEVLPPFQPLDALRELDDPPQEKCNARLVDPEKSSNSDGKLYRPSDEFVFVDSDDGCDAKKLVVSGSQGDKDFPSTTQSCSDADSASVPTKRTPPPLGSEDNNKKNNSNNNTSQEQFIAKSEAVIPPPKSSSKPEAVVKKCKFIVKLSHLGHTAGVKEDAAMNNNNSYMVSEAMASKVCPVCKTFSSSSNTTLNAHIDQCLCLSGDSATKWPGDSRVINKHRIKPRKMRSMADIYETALHCTLEELDRRNGTNWASNSSMPPAQETQISAHKHDGGFSPPSNNSDESPNQSAVYIDANGTKLRILSKFNDPSSDCKSSDDPRPRKLMKGGKFLLAKKKKKNHHLQKQQKLSKHDAPLGKKICTSDPAHTSQIDKDQDRDFSCEKNYAKVDYIPQQLKALDQVKFNKPELIKGWVCSKRTGLTKKINGRDDHLLSGGKANKEMQSENNQSSLCTGVKRSSVVKSRYENSPSPSNSKRIDTSSHEAHSEYEDHPSPIKRLGFSVMESQGCRNRKRSLMVQEFPEKSPKHLKHDGKRRIEVKTGTIRNVEHSVISPKMSSSPQGRLSRSKFSFLKKHALSADGRASASDSKFYSKRKCLAVKKSRMQYLSQTNQKVVVSPTRVDQHFMRSPSKAQDNVRGTSSEESIERTRDIKIRDETVSKEEVVTLKNSQSPITHHHDVGENCGSLIQSGAFGCSSASDARECAGKSESSACRRDISIELPSDETVGGIFTGLSKTIDPRFDGVDEPRDMQCDSQQYIEAYKGPLFESEAPTSSAEPILSGEQEMFCTDVDAENIMGKNARQTVELLDSSNGEGNYFGEVDSIPIPGPPGSFLPSPGRMDSEDIPGISSLSSSRIQSSDGHHQEFIDHSSESPISTTSTISNSTLGRRYDVKSSSENISGGSPLLEQLRSDISAVNTNVVDPIVDNNFAPVSKASDAGGGEGGFGEVKANVTLAEKGVSFRYKNDQPCCCSRKEILMQNVALRYQDSALLRRRTMAAADTTIPSNGKQQMNGDHLNRSLDNGRTVNERSPVPDEARSSMGQISSRVSSVPVHGNYESVSPPTPNPVLRLMGKNLMVVNKEENVAPQLRTTQSGSTMNIHENLKAVPIPMVSNGRSQNEEHRMISQGPFFFDQNGETKGFMEHPDMRWSTSFGSHGISVRPDHQMASVESPGMVSSRSCSTGRGLMGSLVVHQEYSTGGYHTPIQLLQPMNQYRLRIPMKYDMEKAGTESPILRSWKRRKSVEPPENSMKEIIVIDDTPAAAPSTDNPAITTSTTTTTTAVGRHSQQWRGGVESSASRRSSGCDSWSLNPFYVTQPYESVGYTGSGTAVNASFRLLAPSKGGSGNGRWNCNPEGGHQSSLGAASSSPARPRSELYNSSGF